MLIDSLSGCLAQYWRPAFGEPRGIDWAIVLLLYACAVMALLVIRHQGRGAGRRLWGFILLLCLVLGLGKQFDLPQMLTAFARCEPLLEGWHPRLDQVQRILSIWLAALSGLILVMGIAGLGRRSLVNLWALAGLAGMAAFGLLRALRLPAVDAFLAAGWPAATFDDLLQLFGPLMILGNALAHLHRPATRRKRRKRRRRGARGAPSPAPASWRQQRPVAQGFAPAPGPAGPATAAWPDHPAPDQPATE